ncbi:hypothetical protein [Paraburkholderia sp. GAS348]|uniref:hypothetical protein n=1 Tax=Paraburkholderia sp. GAS348 TaxID=3035132 RepID=UPI003D2395E1
MPVALYIDDNYHYQNEEHRAGPIGFDDMKMALAEARRLVDDFLAEARQPQMTASELFAQFKMFGPDPWIVPPDDDGPTVPFSAWNYARERCGAICAATAE